MFADFFTASKHAFVKLFRDGLSDAVRHFPQRADERTAPARRTAREIPATPGALRRSPAVPTWGRRRGAAFRIWRTPPS